MALVANTKLLSVQINGYSAWDGVYVRDNQTPDLNVYRNYLDATYTKFLTIDLTGSAYVYTEVWSFYDDVTFETVFDSDFDDLETVPSSNTIAWTDALGDPVTVSISVISGVEISTPDELQAIGYDADTRAGDYIQTQNIEMNVAPYRSADGFGGFRPIGTDANRFTGTYNGKNFEIQDLFIDRATTNNVGLFGYVGVGTDGEAYLQKIRLKDVDITGETVVGSVFARTDSENVLVENSSADGGTVTGIGGVGGFVGVVSRATIRQSWANITVTGKMTIDASAINAGGFVGVVGVVLSTTCLHDCYSRGNASIYNRAGGFAGNINHSPSILRCYSTGKPTVASGQTAIGGFIGNDVGVSGETIENCYWDKTTAEIATDAYLAVEAGLTTAEAKDKDNYTDWNFNTLWNIGTDNDGYPYLDRRYSGIPSRFGIVGVIR